MWSARKAPSISKNAKGLTISASRASLPSYTPSSWPNQWTSVLAAAVTLEVDFGERRDEQSRKLEEGNRALDALAKQQAELDDPDGEWQKGICRVKAYHDLHQGMLETIANATTGIRAKWKEAYEKVYHLAMAKDEAWQQDNRENAEYIAKVEGHATRAIEENERLKKAMDASNDRIRALEIELDTSGKFEQQARQTDELQNECDELGKADRDSSDRIRALEKKGRGSAEQARSGGWHSSGT